MSAVKKCKQITAADHSVRHITLSESEIRGEKLEKNVEVMSRAEAKRWLKCRGCRNLRELTLVFKKTK